MFHELRTVSWRHLATVYFAFTLYILATGGYFFEDPVHQFLVSVGARVHIPLIYNFALFCVVVLGLVMVWGKLRQQDIGLRWENLARGAGIVLAIWTFSQALGAIGVWATTGGVAPHPELVERGTLDYASLLIGQLFGVALVEEVFMRGYYLPQIWAKFRPKSSSRIAMIAAITLSSILFGLPHIFTGLLDKELTIGSLIAYLIVTSIAGLLFALVYLTTQNIFICIGLHALVNRPTALFDTPFQLPNGPEYIIVAAVLLLPVWHIFRQRRSNPAYQLAATLERS